MGKISFLVWAGLEIFTIKRIAFWLLILTPLLLALVVLPARRAAADDETDEVEIKVQATLDAVNCGATPPTINILGLTVDISTASINRNTDEGDDENSNESGDLTCADLEAALGQVVEVKLASDVPDQTTGLLLATEVDIGGGECEDAVCEEVEIAGQIQDINTIDPTVPKVTVLGLEVDISQASLEGADDGDTEGDNLEGDIEGGNQPIDVSQLLVGQFVEMELNPDELPNLVATTLEVKNFTNQVEVEVIDEDGNQVDDGDVDGVDDGDVDDVEVDVQVTTKVKATPSGAPEAPKRVKKVLRFHTTSNGSFKLAGLPTGRAKIVVTRVHDGQTTSAKRSIRVKANSTKHLHMRLKPVQ